MQVMTRCIGDITATNIMTQILKAYQEKYMVIDETTRKMFT